MSIDVKALTTVHNNTMARRMEHKADEKDTKANSSGRKIQIKYHNDHPVPPQRVNFESLYFKTEL